MMIAPAPAVAAEIAASVDVVSSVDIFVFYVYAVVDVHPRHLILILVLIRDGNIV